MKITVTKEDIKENLKYLKVANYNSVIVKLKFETIATYRKCFFVGNFIGYLKNTKDDIYSFSDIITMEDIKEEAEKLKTDCNENITIINDDTGIKIEI